MAKRGGTPAAIEINPEFARALELMEAGERNLFVTGRAGDGEVDPARAFPRHHAGGPGRPRPHRSRRPQRAWPDRAPVLRVRRRRDPGEGARKPPQAPRLEALGQARDDRHRRGLDAPRGPPRLHRRLPPPARAESRHAVRRSADGLRRRPLPAPAGGDRGRARDLPHRLRDPPTSSAPARSRARTSRSSSCRRSTGRRMPTSSSCSTGSATTRWTMKTWPASTRAWTRDSSPPTTSST